MGRFVKLSACVLAGVLLAACGSDSDDASSGNGDTAPVKIRAAVGASPPGVSQGLYTSIPLRAGFWKDENLDVEVQGFKAGGEAIQALDAGQIDIAVLGAGPAMGAVQNGIPLVAIYNALPRSDQYPAVLPDSPIREAKDLCGKRIGISALTSGVLPSQKAIVAEACGNENAAEYLVVGTGAPALEFLKSNKVDALGLSGSLHRDITAASGQELREIPSPVIDKLGFNIAVFMKKDFLEKNREAAIGFARGIAKGTLYASENLEAAIKLHWAEFPTTKPTGVSDAEALEKVKASFGPRVLKDSAPVEGKWGAATDEQIQSQLDLLLRSGVLKGSTPPINQIWDSSMLNEINDFDAEAVKKAAREAK